MKFQLFGRYFPPWSVIHSLFDFVCLIEIEPYRTSVGGPLRRSAKNDQCDSPRMLVDRARDASVSHARISPDDRAFEGTSRIPDESHASFNPRPQVSRPSQLSQSPASPRMRNETGESDRKREREGRKKMSFLFILQL